MAGRIPQFLLDKPDSQSYAKGRGKIRISFIEKGISQVADVIKSGYIQWETAIMDGFIQGIDARIKIFFLIFYVVIVSLKKEIIPEVCLGVFVFLLVLISRLNIFNFYKRVLLLGFLFGFLIALPSALNLITKGEIIFPLLHLSESYNIWIYHIPAEIGITGEGLNIVAMLTLRVVNSLSVSFLILYTTTFPDIIKALKVMKAPDSFLMIITLSCKYMFIFARTMEDMYLAKMSRLARQVNNTDARNWAGGRIGFIFRRTRLRCEDIFRAMLSRGFSNEVKLRESGKLELRDIVSGGIVLISGMFFLWL